jgi:Family of unknown function (DUF6152)
MSNPYGLQRRSLLISAAASIALPAWAHHGWSSFDEAAPLYLEGTLKEVKWQNPHTELIISVSKDVKLPTDLTKRAVPAQQAAVDAAKVLGNTKLPNVVGTDWRVELAPLFRMQAWQVSEPKAGATAAVIGYTFPKQQGERILRAEFLFIDSKAYSIRSLPA